MRLPPGRSRSIRRVSWASGGLYRQNALRWCGCWQCCWPSSVWRWLRLVWTFRLLRGSRRGIVALLGRLDPLIELFNLILLSAPLRFWCWRLSALRWCGLRRLHGIIHEPILANLLDLIESGQCGSSPCCWKKGASRFHMPASHFTRAQTSASQSRFMHVTR